MSQSFTWEVLFFLKNYFKFPYGFIFWYHVCTFIAWTFLFSFTKANHYFKWFAKRVTTTSNGYCFLTVTQYTCFTRGHVISSCVIWTLDKFSFSLSTEVRRSLGAYSCSSSQWLQKHAAYFKTFAIRHFDQVKPCSRVSNFYSLVQRFLLQWGNKCVWNYSSPKDKNVDIRVALFLTRVILKESRLWINVDLVWFGRN